MKDTRAMRSGRSATYSEDSYPRLLPLSGPKSSRRCPRALPNTSADYSASTSRRRAEKKYGNRDAREPSNGRNSRVSQKDGSTNPRRSGPGPNGNKYMDGNPERMNASAGGLWRSTRRDDALAFRMIHMQPTER